MKRRDFIKNSGFAALGMTFLSSLFFSCEKNEVINVTFSGKVIIIGAGASGLMAGYMLNQYGIDFEILEASSVFGGRVKKIDNFADFPIDLGAEWIHDNPSILGDLINDSSAQGSIDVISYNPNTIHGWKGNQYYQHGWATPFYSEHKFKNTTWYDFLEHYIHPSISHKITYNSPIQDINYTGSQVVLTNSSQQSFTADKVICTVPTPILQNNSITFTPTIPSERQNALDSVYTPDGLKVFIEFSERFYPDILLYGPLLGDSAQEKIYYDAAFKKESNKHILGLFCVGDQATEFVNLGSDQAIFNKVMSELDLIYDGKASQSYIKHVVQNWSTEPFILGSYTHHNSKNEEATLNLLNAPLDNKVYFAGEAYSYYAQATVHGAGLSAYDTVKTILQS